MLGLAAANDTRFISACDALQPPNRRIMRSTNDASADRKQRFVACNSGSSMRVAAIGQRDQARSRFIGLLAHRNTFGLLSEDIHRETGALWGNIPRT